jgi:tRNA-dihydrouridine synthase A
MAEPELIGECVNAMQAAVNIPVTVKNRIGIDDQDDYEGLHRFISTVAQAGCKTFIIHARKAWLKGLSPKENREIPPLRYELVYQIKQEFPQLEILINGGITTLEQCQMHLQHVDGVMVGREAYHNPWVLAQVDAQLYGTSTAVDDRKAIVEAFLPYVQQELEQGIPLGHMTRHILGIFQGMAGARAWRRHISENAHKAGAGVALLREAMQMVRE